MSIIEAVEPPPGGKCWVSGNKIAIKTDSHHVQSVDFKTVFSLLNLTCASRLIQWCCDYLQGKQAKTAKGYLTRLNSTFSHGVRESAISELPSSQDEWQWFIKVLYGSHLTNPNISASLETRVKVWNSIIAPFLEWATGQGHIPIGCLIPKMKRVGELNPFSSFKLNLIGTSSPQPVNGSLDKLIIPVSLSRSDANYLDELYFDLQTKRDALDSVLVKYWYVIKSHIDIGMRLTDQICFDDLMDSFANGQYETITAENDTQARRVHKASIRHNFPNWLALFANMGNGAFAWSKLGEIAEHIPQEYPRQHHIDAVGPTTNGFKLKINHRINLMLGNFSTLDVVVIVMLLTMRTPKFNFHSLLYADITDKDGYTYLTEKDSGWEFSVFKQRAKAKKTDQIDDLSLDILNTVIAVGAKARAFLKSSKLFVVTKPDGVFSLPGEGMVVRKLSSRSPSDKYNILNVIPELQENGFTPGSISFRKLRDTEAVLEWFRTGSIKAVTRKLGNSEKVVLESYLPESLLAIWNTRQIRRFQNLLLTAAAIGENYSVEITDFNSLSELNSFIADMLHLHSGSKNPLIMALGGDHSDALTGSLAVPISTKSLTSIYLYEHAAHQSGVSSGVLKRKSVGIDISPLSIVQLSLLLKQNLPNHKTSAFKQAHMCALKEVEKIKNDILWSRLFLAAEEAC